MKEYTTIHAPAQDEFVERKSRFIGQIAPAGSEEEALAFLAAVRAKHREAAHNCWAYVLQSGAKRCSDDGEPQGTAGVPILECVEREGLTDAVLVVTRYFGGTLLGAGGLVRAYSHAAKLAVDAASRRRMRNCILCSMEMDYSLYGKVNHLLPQYQMAVKGSDFGAVVRLTVLFGQDSYQQFVREVTELTAAQVVPRLLEECFAELPQAQS